MQRNKPTIQQYDTYTAEDFSVWDFLFSRQMELLNENASAFYLEALTNIGFNAKEIPHFEKTNERMKALTGWRLSVVPEIVPQKDFFEMLARKTFPATCWLRTRQEVDYIEEPDMFHDVFGHAPLLVNPVYATFMEAVGHLALKWVHEPAVIQLLGSFYWFTIEFGLLREQNEPKIFGAGIISSFGETKHTLTGVSTISDFNVHEMLHTKYRTDILQDRYFVIDSFEELFHAVKELDVLLEKHTF